MKAGRILTPKTFCQRCGERIYVTRAKKDGHIKGLVVCPDCWDRKHPADTPVIIKGKEIKRHPLQIPEPFEFEQEQTPWDQWINTWETQSFITWDG